MTKVCCVCQRVLIDGTWSTEYGFAADEPVTHGYCPSCYAEAMAALAEFVARRQLLQGAAANRGYPDAVVAACG